MKKLIFYAFLVLFSLEISAQKRDTIIPAIVQSGDTLLIKDLEEVEVFPRFLNAFQSWKYTRLVRYVKKVYPYAVLATDKMKEYEKILLATKNPAEQRKIMRKVEDEIWEEWGDELKELTFMQGGILLKLIDRQTGESSFELVKEFRGSFRAFFYQTFARIFGFNLKERYDPQGKDRDIEYIVRLIETNRL